MAALGKKEPAFFIAPLEFDWLVITTVLALGWMRTY